MKKLLLMLCVIMLESVLVSCSSNDDSIISDEGKLEEEQKNDTEAILLTEKSDTLDSESTEAEVRFGSRTNVMQMGESITLPYADWNSSSDGEITVSAISSQDGKTILNIALNSQTKNIPFVAVSDQVDYIYSTVYFLETDDPMSFVWNSVDLENYLIADESVTIAVGSSQDVIYNTHKQYAVIITSVQKETDHDTTFDSASSNYNCYYTFIQLY